MPGPDDDQLVLDQRELDTPAPGQDQPPPPTESDDPDLMRLREAEAELAAEEQGGEGEGDGEVEQLPVGDEPPPAQEPPPEQPQQPTPQQGARVPSGRLREEAERRRSVEDENAFLRGQLDMAERLMAQQRQPVARPTSEAPPPPPPPTPLDQIKALRATQLEQAKRYNEGELDFTEYEQRRTAIDDQIADIRDAATAQRATQSAVQTTTDPARDPGVRARTAQLEQDFPVLQYVEYEEIQPFESIAAREMAKAGTPYNPRDPESLYELRVRVAELAEHNYGHLVPPQARQPQPAGRTAEPGTRQPAGGAPASRQPGVTAQQREAKLALAERLPPNIHQSGRAAPATGLSEQQILAMSTSDFEQMSPAELEALEARLQ